MHPHIQKLSRIARMPERTIIGLMSGTSLDGLDVALCRVRGAGRQTEVDLAAFETVAYTPEDKARIRRVFSKDTVELPVLCALNPWVGLRHADMVLDCLKAWGMSPSDIDCIASHGQTVYHAPCAQHGLPGFPNSTLQLGDGDHVAMRTGILTVADFRQKHIAAGGEGAPLAVYGDFLIFGSGEEDRILLNMGGIANITYLPKSLDPVEVFSSDVGTGNTLMDAYVQRHYPGREFDDGATLARQGSVDRRLLDRLKDHAFFDHPMPKTTGPELFNLTYLERAQSGSRTQDLPPTDVLATLNRFSADMIVHALKRLSGRAKPPSLYVSGGGAHNPLLMHNVREQLPGTTIRTTDALGINPDAKEAVLFALLANETLCASGESLCNESEGIPAVTMGKICFPD